MIPLQLGQLLCAIATARSAVRMDIIGGEGGEEWRLLSWQLAFTAARECELYARLQRTTDWLPLINRRDVLYPSDALIVAPLFTQSDLQALNSTLSEIPDARLSWAIVAVPELVTPALGTLPWQLDNQMLLLSWDVVVSVWTAYRPGPRLPVRSQILSALSLPPHGPTEQQLSGLRGDLLSSRDDLKGLVLRCSILEWAPYTILMDNPDGTVNITGYYGDIWNYLQQMLGFTGVCRRPRDGSWGGGDHDTGEWSGIFGELNRAEADISPCSYGVTEERSKRVDFSMPIGNSYSVMIIQRPIGIDGGTNYTQEFSTSVWWIILTFYMICVMMMKIMTKMSKTETARDLSYSLVTNCRIFCNMGFAEEGPRGSPYRSWLILVVTLMQVLHIYYSAFLIAFVASGQIALPFEDLKGIYAMRDEYQLGTVKDTFLEASFKYSNNPVHQKLWSTLYPDNLLSADEGVARVTKDDKFAYVLPHPFFAANYRSCDLLELPTRHFQLLEAMLLTPRGPANPIINRALAKMIESGVMRQRQRFWFGKGGDQSSACESAAVSPLGLKQTYTAFLLLGMSAAAAVTILALELIKYRLEK